MCLRAPGVDSAENPIYVLVKRLLWSSPCRLSSLSQTSLLEADPILQFLVEHLERSFLTLWCERVSSEANIADGLSRNDVSLLEDVDRLS